MRQTTDYNYLSSEGVAVITDETYDQLLDTFDNVEQEEFFEVSTFIKEK